MKILLKYFLLLSILITSPLFARTKLQGIVEKGGQNILTSGLQSTTKSVQTFPISTVTVYLTGTTTLAPLYSDIAGTIKANPFTSGTDASWFFFIDDGTYDIKFSPSGFAAWTLSSILVGSSTSVVLAPPPSGGDDYATLQGLISTYNAAGVEVQLPAGVYLDTAELVPALHFPLRLRGNGFVYQTSGGGGTTIKLTQSARSVIAVTEKYGYIQGIVLDANRLGTYGIFLGALGGGTANRFIDGRTTNALLDGIHCDAAELNQASSTAYWASESNGKIYATAAILNQYPNNAVRQTSVAGTASIVSGGTTITITGGQDITTLGVRVGDLIRVGPTAATSFYGQIAAVTHVSAGNDTITLQPLITPTSTMAGLDFAVLIGWGWYEELQGGNGYNILGGNGVSWFRGNGGGGIFMNALYGDHVKDAIIDGNNGAGIAMGLAYNTGTLFQPTSEGVYMENNLGPDYVLGNIIDGKIDTPGGNSTIQRIDSGTASAVVVIHGDDIESVRFGLPQNLLVEFRNNAGTIQHRIVADHWLGNNTLQATKIVGQSATWTNTPTVSNVVDFTTGVGIYDAGGVLEVVLNTARAQIVNSVPGAVLEFDSSGTTYLVQPTISNINVNGTTMLRPSVFLTDTSGNLVSINTTTLAAGKSIGIRIRGSVR